MFSSSKSEADSAFLEARRKREALERAQAENSSLGSLEGASRGGSGEFSPARPVFRGWETEARSAPSKLLRSASSGSGAEETVESGEYVMLRPEDSALMQRRGSAEEMFRAEIEGVTPLRRPSSRNSSQNRPSRSTSSRSMRSESSDASGTSQRSGGKHRSMRKRSSAEDLTLTSESSSGNILVNLFWPKQGSIGSANSGSGRSARRKNNSSFAREDRSGKSDFSPDTWSSRGSRNDLPPRSPELSSRLFSSPGPDENKQSNSIGDPEYESQIANARVYEALQNARKENKELEKQLLRSEENANRLSERYTELEKDLERHGPLQEKLNKELDQRDDELEKSFLRSTSLENEKQRLEKELKAKQSDLNEARSELAKLRSENEDLKSTLENKIEAFSNERKDLELQIAARRVDIDELNQEIKKLTEQIRQHQKQETEARQRAEDSFEKAKRIREEEHVRTVEELQTKLSEMSEKHINEKEALLKDLEDKFELDRAERIFQHNAKVKEMDIKIQSLQDKISHLDEIKSLSPRSSSQYKKMIDENLFLKKELEKERILRKKLQDKDEEMKELQKKVKRLSKSKDTTVVPKQDLESLNRKVQQLETERGTFQQTIRILRSKLQDVGSEPTLALERSFPRSSSLQLLVVLLLFALFYFQPSHHQYLPQPGKDYIIPT